MSIIPLASASRICSALAIGSGRSHAPTVSRRRFASRQKRGHRGSGTLPPEPRCSFIPARVPRTFDKQRHRWREKMYEGAIWDESDMDVDVVQYGHQIQPAAATWSEATT